jgi:hypothetical protein
MSGEPAVLTRAPDKADAEDALNLETNPINDFDQQSVIFNSSVFASWKHAFQHATKLHGRGTGANWWKTTNIVVTDSETKQFQLQCAGCFKSF